MPLQDWVKKEFAPQDILAEERQAALIEEMGISTSDAAYLRKSALSAEEAVSAKQEELGSIRTHKGRKSNWLAYLDIKARMGYVLSGAEVVRRFRSLLPQLRVYDGRVRGTWGLASPITKTFEDGFHAGYEYLGWCHEGMNPEYEIDLTDEDGVPRGSKRGYRTTLLNIITRKDGTGKFVLKSNGVVQDGSGLPLKILTEDKVEQAFGYPTNGPTGSEYRRQLWEFRNGRLTNPVAWT